MKIVHVYSGNYYGGVERLLVSLARCERQWHFADQHFILFFEGQLSKELSSVGAQIDQLAPVRFSRPWTIVSAQKILKETLAHLSADYIICHELWAYSIAAPVTPRKSKLILWKHGWIQGWRWYEILAKRVTPDLILVPSHYAGGDLKKLFQKVKHTVLYPPVYPISVRENERNGPFQIYMISRMVPYKGHELLIRALEKLEKGDWEVKIVGGPQNQMEKQYYLNLQKLTAQKGLDNQVKFLGHCQHVDELLAQADVFCHPNIGSEPFGIVFIESLYAGVPVVTTHLGAAPEIINDQCGFLISPKVEELRNCLNLLMKNRDIVKNMASACINRARDLCDPEKFVERFKSALLSI